MYILMTHIDIIDIISIFFFSFKWNLGSLQSTYSYVKSTIKSMIIFEKSVTIVEKK